jgi:hypothetical protein
LQIEIEEMTIMIEKATKLEEEYYDQLTDDTYYIQCAKDDSSDPWAQYEGDKASFYLKSDNELFQRQRSFRMRLEKEKRLLEQRIKKIQAKFNDT